MTIVFHLKKIVYLLVTNRVNNINTSFKKSFSSSFREYHLHLLLSPERISVLIISTYSTELLS